MIIFQEQEKSFLTLHTIKKKLEKIASELCFTCMIQKY